MRPAVPLVLATLTVALGAAGACAHGEKPAQRPAVSLGGDWTRFGYDAARRNTGPRATGITAASVGRVRRQRVSLDGTVDSSPIYLRRAAVGGAHRDLFIVTTSYGRTIALDADTGAVIWRYTPPGYASWAGSYRITNSTPVADPSRRFVYAAAPDGRIHKVTVATGEEVRSGGWPVAITRNPSREKIGPALNLARGLVLAATGGYVGDEPPYQGHVVAIDARSGRIAHVWNALCSDRRGLLVPRSCSESGAAIWARSGVVVDPATGNLLVASGDGRWNGRTHWGDSVLTLSRNAGRLLRNWTPTDQAELDSGDVDLGSTAPALLNSSLAVQGGKDGKLRLLDLRRLNGRTTTAGTQTGGELQTISTPGGDGLFSAPAVWRNGTQTRVFAATDSGTWCYVLSGRRLRVAWRQSAAGTSPVVAGGLLYVYDQRGGRLNVYVPASGKLVTRLAAGDGHWNSPIVTDGRIALPEGDANDHRTSGTLDIYRLG
jgi:outer membrane protein assembly factor BamB